MTSTRTLWQRCQATAILIGVFAAVALIPAQAETSPAQVQLSTPMNGKFDSTATEEDHNAQAQSATDNKVISGLFWSLPMNGNFTKSGTAVSRLYQRVTFQPSSKQLEATVSLSDQSSFVAKRVDQLLDAALDHDPSTAVLDQAVKHYNTVTQKVLAESKDATDYLIPYRGFGPSSEAGDIILDEKLNVKSRASAEYARQKHIDEKHVAIVSSMSQIAMGMGMEDKARGEAITASGVQSLKELVGDEEVQKTLELLQSWKKTLRVSEAIYAQGVWDVNQRQEKLKFVMQTSLSTDPVVREVERRLHKYNHHSKVGLACSHIVETSLGTVSLAPDFIGPAAKVALLGFIMATGGPEQCKMTKELYLDKRFESRTNVVAEEAHLALDNYHIALLTHNPCLLAFSESLIGEMTGPDSVAKVLGNTVLAWEPQDASGCTIDAQASQSKAPSKSTEPETHSSAVAQRSGVVTQ